MALIARQGARSVTRDVYPQSLFGDLRPYLVVDREREAEAVKTRTQGWRWWPERVTVTGETVDEAGHRLTPVRRPGAAASTSMSMTTLTMSP